jgi:hypothetical protein
VATYLVLHEVHDVDRWRKSSKRDELFQSRGITHRTFHDPDGSNRVGLICEIPDIDAFQELVQSEDGAEAMKHDGVRPETILLLAER